MELEKVIEMIIAKANPKKKANMISERDFIDLLNYSLENPEVKVIYLNRKSSLNRFGHKVEYKGYVFVVTTERKIYDL